MKKLLLFAGALMMLSACAKDGDNTSPVKEQNPEGQYVPYFYGVATLDNDQPSTRGVVDENKVWNHLSAAEKLTVKFMVTEEEYKKDPLYREWIDLVKDVSAEWEECCGVRFHFKELFTTENTLIRIKFDNNRRGLKTSYSYTGTDHLAMRGKQNEPTMVFAQWSGSEINRKRGDILRAFGQVIGLELEHRHPKLGAKWIDNIEDIKDYWEYHLKDFITWEEIQSLIIDPIQKQTTEYVATADYDKESVMNWPFLEKMIENIPPQKAGDQNYIATISQKDKVFVKRLYGERISKIPEKYVVLAEFTYTGNSPSFSFDTTEDVFVIWDEEADLATSYRVPSGTTSPKTIPAEHKYKTSGTRKIKVCQEEEKLFDKVQKNSKALHDFSIRMGSEVKGIDIKTNNVALNRIFIEGGTTDLAPQNFKFANFKALKELYLVQIQDSKVRVENCDELEILATSRNIYIPKGMPNPPSFSPGVNKSTDVHFSTDELKQWPEFAEARHSLSGKGASSLQIRGCNKIKAISLEHTQLLDFNFSSFTNLEYVYLSSTEKYLAGGPYYEEGAKVSFTDIGCNLDDAIASLPSRTDMVKGNIVVRNVELHTPGASYSYHRYVTVCLHYKRNNNISTNLQNKNWNVVWDSDMSLIYVM